MSTVEREDWGVQEVQEGCYGCPWGQGKSRKSNEVKRDVKGVPRGQLSTTDIPGGQGVCQGCPGASIGSLGVSGCFGGVPGDHQGAPNDPLS